MRDYINLWTEFQKRWNDRIKIKTQVYSYSTGYFGRSKRLQEEWCNTMAENVTNLEHKMNNSTWIKYKVPVIKMNTTN